MEISPHMTMNSLNSFFAGISTGIIIFQSVVIAPLVFSQLKDGSAGPFLRALFPRFFLALTLFAALIVVNSIVMQQPTSAILSAAAVLAGVVAYLIIPATNRARDQGRSSAFKKLHLTSILLMLVIATTNFLVLLI
ncbi:MAG: DUF4149 domain-containing protein [Proteobacteria bacterium]|nr:DUF4149 domain-containing protein [Pseudomonadota bacterium]MBT6932760.1 DUF4149 domain-containing protein [Pseudomonadota bacterium]